MPEPTVVNADPTKDDRANAAANYGFSLAVIRSHPQLRKAFESAVSYGWSPQRFIAEIRDTDWFKNNAANWREKQTLKLTDPATYKRDVEAVRASARDNAAAMGAVLTDAQLDRFAQNTYMFGWNDSQQRNTLATYVQVAAGGALKGQYIGEAGKNAQELRTAAMRNGYKIPKHKLQEWNKSILSGNSSMEDYQAFIRRQAAAAFPTFAEELNAGADLEDLASPYMDSMARILELNPREVNLFDPKVRKAMASKDAKTGKPSAVPIYDFETQLREDPRWMKTRNAHEEVMGMGRQVLQMMGF